MKTYVPQADKLAKIEDIPLAIEDGKRSMDALARRYRFDRRQSQYYVEAESELGLVEHKEGECHLTTLGTRYVAYSQDQRTKLLLKSILSLPVFQAIVIELRRRPNHQMPATDLVKLLADKAELSESTARRRLQTVLKWLGWVGQRTKTIKITRNANVLIQWQGD